MLTTKNRQAWFCFLLGGLTAVLTIFTIAITAAIAAPISFFDWFKSRDALTAGIFIWDLAVVYGLGLGVLAFLLLLAAFRLVARPSFWSALLFVMGFLLTAHLAVPISSGTPLSFFYSRPVNGFALEVSLIVAAVGALLLARRLWPNDSFKPSPHRYRPDLKLDQSGPA